MQVDSSVEIIKDSDMGVEEFFEKLKKVGIELVIECLEKPE